MLLFSEKLCSALFIPFCISRPQFQEQGIVCSLQVSHIKVGLFLHVFLNVILLVIYQLSPLWIFSDNDWLSNEDLLNPPRLLAIVPVSTGNIGGGWISVLLQMLMSTSASRNTWRPSSLRIALLALYSQPSEVWFLFSDYFFLCSFSSISNTKAYFSNFRIIFYNLCVRCLKKASCGCMPDYPNTAHIDSDPILIMLFCVFCVQTKVSGFKECREQPMEWKTSYERLWLMTAIAVF